MIFLSDLPSKRLSDDILESTRITERSQDVVLRWGGQGVLGVLESGFTSARGKLIDRQPPQHELRPPVEADLSTDTQECLLEEFALVQPVFRSLCERLIRGKIFNCFSLDRRMRLSRSKGYYVIRRVLGGTICTGFVRPMCSPLPDSGTSGTQIRGPVALRSIR